MQSPTTSTPAPRAPAVLRNGYSLIELLVVVSFIAILAAIAIPRFPMVRELAVDAAVKSDLQNAMQAEEVYFGDNGAFKAFIVVDGGSIAAPFFDASEGVTVTATIVGQGVRIVGSHAASPHSWCISTDLPRVDKGANC
ncbi:MAG TPA: prepilin-type N-terminal cleavage/methylation domain-containing protein [Gemmatimonadota bacterium]|nr:prepilin-type N-terminal cleavage/methylation domain-containing protein [Gemmatimonadota bacterium]